MSHVWLRCVLSYSRDLDRSLRDSNAHTMNKTCITESLQERGVDACITMCGCTCVHHKPLDVSTGTMHIILWCVLASLVGWA